MIFLMVKEYGMSGQVYFALKKLNEKLRIKQ